MNEWPWWAQLFMDVINGFIIFIAAFLGTRASMMVAAREAAKRIINRMENPDGQSETERRFTKRD